MMRWLLGVLLTAMVAAMAGCGDTLTAGDDTATTAASITLIASSPQMGSALASEVTLTAIVKDAANRALAEEAVSFTSTSGSLLVTQPFTDNLGKAIATLSPGVASNRTITVTATSGAASASYMITVAGTTVSVAGNTSAVLGATTPLTITVRDSSNTGVPSAVVTVSSVNGNTIAPAVVTANASGVATVNLTGTIGGVDTINVSAMGATGTHSISVSADTFSVATAASIDIDTCTPVTATWAIGGTPVAGSPVDFQATRGTLYTNVGCGAPGTQATTDGAGVATIYVTSPNAGPSSITASGGASGPTASTTTQFVATTPDSLVFQASRTTLGLNDSVTLTATVRDATYNLVKDAVVEFTIEADTTGGGLSPATGVTDTLGRASTVYSSTVQPSATNGVQIRATVQGTAISEDIYLTVGGAGLSLSLGMATRIESVNNATYRYSGAVQVADAAGNPVAGQLVTLRLDPESYDKGYRTGTPPIASSTVTGPLTNTFTVFVNNGTLSCANEDTNRNGILDAGEDFNGNGTLEPGTPATVTASVTTDPSGNGTFDVVYPKDYANWLQVKITGTIQVAGTESTKAIRFLLPMSEADTSNPPGMTSPYGTASACNIPD